MNVNLLLSIVMLIVGLAFLTLTFLFPDEIKIGAFLASIAIAAIFYVQYMRKKKRFKSN